MLRWGKTRIAHVLDASGAMKRRVTSPSYELYPGRHEPIISKEDFACAQAKLHRSNRPSHRHSLTNPLSGLLVCSACGAVMHGLPAYGRASSQHLLPNARLPQRKNLPCARAVRYAGYTVSMAIFPLARSGIRRLPPITAAR